MCFSSISFSRPPGQMRGGLGPSASCLLPERYPQAAITLCQDVKNPRPPPSDVSPSVTPPPPAPVSASDAECPKQAPLRREKVQLRHSLSFSCWGNGGPRGGVQGLTPWPGVHAPCSVCILSSFLASCWRQSLSPPPPAHLGLSLPGPPLAPRAGQPFIAHHTPSHPRGTIKTQNWGFLSWLSGNEPDSYP